MALYSVPESKFQALSFSALKGIEKKYHLAGSSFFGGISTITILGLKIHGLFRSHRLPQFFYGLGDFMTELLDILKNRSITKIICYSSNNFKLLNTIDDINSNFVQEFTIMNCSNIVNI